VSQGGDRQEDMHVARAVQPGKRQGETGPGIRRRRLQPQVVRLPTAVLPERSVTVLVAADQQLFDWRRCSPGGVRSRARRCDRAKREYYIGVYIDIILYYIDGISLFNDDYYRQNRGCIELKAYRPMIRLIDDNRPMVSFSRVVDGGPNGGKSIERD